MFKTACRYRKLYCFLCGIIVKHCVNKSAAEAVAAAVADVYGEYRYAFSVSAPVSRMNGEKLAKVGKAVVETANRISNGEKADKNIVNII